ncbi:hypothetical protein ACE6H2_010975 [Prunus campanulata]
MVSVRGLGGEAEHRKAMAVSLLAAQILELIAALLLLQSTAKPQYKFVDFFKANKVSKERSWLLASAVGFGFLFILVFLTSFLADSVVGPKAINNPVLKEILISTAFSIQLSESTYAVMFAIECHLCTCRPAKLESEKVKIGENRKREEDLDEGIKEAEVLFISHQVVE